jgi:uncharacterized membrane protein YdbT with pleckstrin-like domain
MMKFFSIFTKTQDYFEGEENGEKVVLLVRRHPFFIIMRVIFSIILALVPIAVYISFAPIITSHNLTDVFFFAYSLWCLFIWSSIFYALTMYSLDVWIVTDHRIIDNTQNGFFSRTVSELHLSRVQDISVETKGVIQTFIKFGDLQVQTAAAEEKFKFSQISNPLKIKDEIMKVVSLHTPSHL